MPSLEGAFKEAPSHFFSLKLQRNFRELLVFALFFRYDSSRICFQLLKRAIQALSGLNACPN